MNYNIPCNTPTGSLINNINIVNDPKKCPSKYGRIYCKSGVKIGYECITNTRTTPSVSK